ncbi:MAG: hypothetical protein H6577_07595 [Lewinellaceae bacterium]|nr:hypothetical protein [Saprospiraceae bacterium]MCB9337976.1 hypothetical protein [Lewinellaceae bacterium]
MKNRFFFGFMALLLTSAITLNSCKDDDQPKTTKVSGTITIDNVDQWATWQDSGVLEVTVFPAFSLDPPSGWGTVPAGTFGPNDPGGTYPLGAPYNSQNPFILQYKAGQTQYEYDIELEPGTYSALAIGFRKDDVTSATCKTATLGVYYGNENAVSHGIVIPPFLVYPAPLSFEIKEQEQKEFNFKADFSFVNIWYSSCQ